MIINHTAFEKIGRIYFEKKKSRNDIVVRHCAQNDSTPDDNEQTKIGYSRVLRILARVLFLKIPVSDDAEFF